MILINENIDEWHGIKIVDVLLNAKMVKSKTEARRIIEQKGVKIHHKDGEIIKIKHKNAVVILLKGERIIIQKGKKSFCEIYF